DKARRHTTYVWNWQRPVENEAQAVDHGPHGPTAERAPHGIIVPFPAPKEPPVLTADAPRERAQR
ncbi:MAG TPA: hypothetical protein VHE35_27890, partial [Kofleriaceae bacterium]|nr:hypothetical protein [Kofleriaceae bacterium]